RRLLAAMGAVREILTGPRPVVEPQLRDLAPGDLGWVVQRHGALYAAEHRWDATFEAMVARIVAELGEHRDPARERGWIAELDGAGGGGVLGAGGSDGGTAKLGVLLVDPRARRHGLGARLVDACVDFARAAGYRRITLWTYDVLTGARRLYERAGFILVERKPEHSYGHDLVGETWVLDL